MTVMAVPASVMSRSYRWPGVGTFAGEVKIFIGSTEEFAVSFEDFAASFEAFAAKSCENCDVDGH